MTPEQQRIIIVAKAKAKARAAKQTGGQMMRHVNQGIADVADFFNPFDTDHALNPFGQPVGSQQAADALGIELGGEPETAWQAAQQGVGQAAAGLFPVAKGLQALRGAGGVVGQFADDAYQALTRYMGAGAEMAAGAASEGGRKGAENAGAPQWVQDTASVAAPMSLAAVQPVSRAVGRAALNVGEKLPLSGPVVRAARQLPGKVMAAAAPYTNTGGRQVASERARELAGGNERAAELAERLKGENPLNLTPAEMTNDPGMLAWQQEAARQDPALAARLADRAEASTRAARSAISEPGDVANTQSFLGDRLRKYKIDMESRAEDALRRTEKGVRDVGTNSYEPGDNSAALMRQVDEAFLAAKADETALWARVPKDAVVGVYESRQAAQAWARELGQTRAHDIPPGVRRFLLDDNDAITDQATVRELHGLYSDLRQAARNARAGTNTNPTLAKVADEVADAILKDLDTPEAGPALQRAREASRQLHETFDQGAIGRLRRQTNAGDTATDPELALERTIGRGGTQAKVADKQFTAAVGDRSRPFVADYLKGTFGEKAFDANGKFTRAGANGFIRNNQELLRRYPELRRDISEAVGERLGAEEFAARIGKAVEAAESARYSAAARFLNATPEKALDTILSDKNPARAAAKIVAQARKDDTGRALAGFKNAVSRRLIDTAFSVKAGRLTGNGDALVNALDDPKTLAALRQIYSPPELNRLKMIGRHMAQLQNSRRAQPEIGGLVESRAGRLVETLGRIAGARMGAQVAGGSGAGPSLQAAQIGSSRVKEALGYLASDKASQMMADAIEDPQLFAALLTEVAAPKVEKVLPRLIPYLVGTGVTSE